MSDTGPKDPLVMTRFFLFGSIKELKKDFLCFIFKLLDTVCILLINVKCQHFNIYNYSRINYMLSSVEHLESFITSRPDFFY